MKKVYLLSAILLGTLLSNSASAQISVHIGLNFPPRRVYVPAPQPPVEAVYDDDFDDSDDYYYLPEVEAYYSVPLGCYFYNDGSRWIRAAYLPGAYRNYDWRTARRFEIRGRRPYINHNVYRNRWGGNAGRGDWSRRNDNNGRGNGNYGYNRGGGFDRDNRGGYGQPQRNDRNGWSNRNDDRGSWGRGRPGTPQRPSNGYDRGSQGGYGQQYPQQPSNGQQGGGRGNWGGSQPGSGQQSGNGGQQGGGRGSWGGGQQGGGQQPANGGQQGGGRGNWGGGQQGGGNRDRGGSSGSAPIVAQNGGGFGRSQRF